METESLVNMGTTSKRTIDSTGDSEMEEANINKKARIQGPEEEEEVGTQLKELMPDHLSFQITLENPPPIVASSTSEVSITDLEDNVVTIGSSWPIRKFIEQRNIKVKERMQRVMAS